MLDDLRVNARVTIPKADLSWSAARSSGPGGQNVNKVSSKVDLRFDLRNTRALRPTEKARLRAIPGVRLDADGSVIVVSQLTRDLPRNLDDALEKLRALVARALVVPKKRKPTKPTKGATRRRLEDKRKQSDKKRARRSSSDE
jgi:ribosome-associated protein